MSQKGFPIFLPVYSKGEFLFLFPQVPPGLRAMFPAPFNCLSRYPDASAPATSKSIRQAMPMCAFTPLFLFSFPFHTSHHALCLSPEFSAKSKKTEACLTQRRLLSSVSFLLFVPDLSFVSVILRILTGSLSYCKLLLYPSESFVSPKMPFPTFLTPSCR